MGLITIIKKNNFILLNLFVSIFLTQISVAQDCSTYIFNSNCACPLGLPNCDPKINCSLGFLDGKCIMGYHFGFGWNVVGCNANSVNHRHIGFVAGESQAHLRLIVTGCDPMYPEGIVAGVLHVIGECDTSTMSLLDYNCNCTLEGDSIDLIFQAIHI